QLEEAAPVGNLISPVIKICGNPKTCNWMRCNIDIDASKIITENKRIEDVSAIIWQKLKDICNGEKTQAEILGFDEIAIWRVRGTFPFSLE
ncbi:unnamed protein product, partial [marine sediment metagenome]